MALHLKSTGLDFTDFSSLGSATTELFDDYEEGAFVPGMSPSGASGMALNSGVNERTLIYTKIGRFCQCHGSLYVTNGGTATGYVLLSLPFTSKTDASNQREWSFGSFFTSGAATSITPAWVVYSNASYASHYHYTGTAMSSTLAEKFDTTVDWYINYHYNTAT